MDEDSITEQKTWQIYSFGKINVFRLHLNDSWSETLAQRKGGRGRSFHVDGPKTEKKRKEEEAVTNSAMSGARNLEAESIRSRIDSTSP